MEIIFLGTSSGVPTQERNVSASVVKMANSKAWCLIDCGEGTQHQLLATPLSLNNLQVIFITHTHGDHCYGLPGLIATTSMNNRTTPLTIVAPVEIKEWLENTIELTQMRLTYKLSFIDVVAMSNGIKTNDFLIERVALSHRVPSFAYIFTERNIKPSLDVEKLNAVGIESGPLWGAIQRGENVVLNGDPTLQSCSFLLDVRKPRQVIIAGDNDTPDLLADVARYVDVLVHEATYTEEIAIKVGKMPQHSCAKRVADFASTYHVKHLILTHFSARYQDGAIHKIEQEANLAYEGNLFLAEDYDCYRLSMKGELTKYSLRALVEK